MIKRYDEFLNEGFKYEYGCVMVKFDVPNWKDILNEIFIFELGVFGMPARSCEDFINQ